MGTSKEPGWSLNHLKNETDFPLNYDDSFNISDHNSEKSLTYWKKRDVKVDYVDLVKHTN
jgi:hypothetical protein